MRWLLRAGADPSLAAKEGLLAEDATTDKVTVCCLVQGVRQEGLICIICHHRYIVTRWYCRCLPVSLTIAISCPMKVIRKVIKVAREENIIPGDSSSFTSGEQVRSVPCWAQCYLSSTLNMSSGPSALLVGKNAQRCNPLQFLLQPRFSVKTKAPSGRQMCRACVWHRGHLRSISSAGKTFTTVGYVNRGKDPPRL